MSNGLIVELAVLVAAGSLAAWWGMHPWSPRAWWQPARFVAATVIVWFVLARLIGG